MEYAIYYRAERLGQSLDITQYRQMVDIVRPQLSQLRRSRFPRGRHESTATVLAGSFHALAHGPAFSTIFLNLTASAGARGVPFTISSMLFSRSARSGMSSSSWSARSLAASSRDSVQGKGLPHFSQKAGISVIVLAWACRAENNKIPPLSKPCSAHIL
jgi:hypothetical protein